MSRWETQRESRRLTLGKRLNTREGPMKFCASTKAPKLQAIDIAKIKFARRATLVASSASIASAAAEPTARACVSCEELLFSVFFALTMVKALVRWALGKSGCRSAWNLEAHPDVRPGQGRQHGLPSVPAPKPGVRGVDARRTKALARGWPGCSQNNRPGHFS